MAVIFTNCCGSQGYILCFLLSVGVYYPQYGYMNIAGGEATSSYSINISAGEILEFESTYYTR